MGREMGREGGGGVGERGRVPSYRLGRKRVVLGIW